MVAGALYAEIDSYEGGSYLRCLAARYVGCGSAAASPILSRAMELAP